ncbi:MAG: helix-turn-helix transcriptional regulator [Clostridiales bacterium]|nr:helix-turn-helix transcriptional regulator [Clostridiales bacterium]
MFKRINNKNFGSYLTRLRTTHNHTKINLAKEAGVTDETIRRIESGQNTPSFSTLNNLSRVLKVDLVKVYTSMIDDNVLNDFYTRLDGFIISNDVEKLTSITEDFILYEKKVYNNDIDEIKEVRQFKTILQGLELSLKAENGSIEAYNLYFNAIKLSIPKFSVSSIEDFEYSYLELKCILLLALEENTLNNYEESNRLSLILLKCIDKSNIFDYSEKLIYFRSKTLLNIAYNYHGLDDDRGAYEYADKGIKYCLDKHSLYLLHALFYRRAVASYYLKIDEKQMMKDFSNSVAILDSYNMDSLKKTYIDATKEKYNIDLSID